jgi:hypothetical protein
VFPLSAIATVDRRLLLLVLLFGELLQSRNGSYEYFVKHRITVINLLNYYSSLVYYPNYIIGNTIHYLLYLHKFFELSPKESKNRRNTEFCKEKCRELQLNMEPLWAWLKSQKTGNIEGRLRLTGLSPPPLHVKLVQTKFSANLCTFILQ